MAVTDLNSSLRDLDAAEVFRLLVRYTDECRERQDPSGYKLFLDGERVYDDLEILELLPGEADQSLQGYHRRMNELFPDYCLVCDELLQVNDKKQNRLTEFTQTLYRHVGFPNRFAEMGLYLGNYRKTPFGVHVDGCGVFSFPVAGTKKFRIWKPEYVQKNPDLNRAFDYSKHKKQSLLLTAKPGDMTYWPSSAWHIAESDGHFSATWSLGVWVDKPQIENIAQPILQMLNGKLREKATETATRFRKLHNPEGEVLELPDVYRQAIQALRSLSEAELEAGFLEFWTKHISTQGFKSQEKPTSKKVRRLGSKLSLRHPQAPILWTTSKNSVTFAIQGQTFQTARSERLLELVKDLNTGKICQASNYLKGPLKVQDTKILKDLAAAGAFRHSREEIT